MHKISLACIPQPRLNISNDLYIHNVNTWQYCMIICRGQASYRYHRSVLFGETFAAVNEVFLYSTFALP